MRLWEARSRPKFLQNRAGSRDASTARRKKKIKATTVKSKQKNMCSHVTCIIDRGRANKRTPPSPTHTTHPRRMLSFFRTGSFADELRATQRACPHTHTPTRCAPRHPHKALGAFRFNHLHAYAARCTSYAPLTAVREKKPTPTSFPANP